MKHLVLISCLLLVMVHLAEAQYTSRLGRFKVDQIRGCAPFTITITDTNLKTTNQCTLTNQCNMVFDGVTQSPNKFSYTYNTAGTYKVTVIYPNIGGDDISVIVDPNIQPAFDVYTCANSGVYVNVTDKTYDSYTIDFNDGTVVAIPSGNSQTATHTYTTLTGRNLSVKGFKLNAAPNCNAQTHSFTPLANMPIPTINTLTAVDANDIKIDYTPQTNIQYHLEIGINNSINFQLYQTLYGVNTTTSANLRVDDNYYCYRLSSYDPCNSTNTYSFPVCSDKLSVVAASGVNQLSWATSSQGIVNTEIKGNIDTIIPGSTGSFDDQDITCKTKYCYNVINHYAGSTTSISLQKCVTSFTTDIPTAIADVSTVVNGNDVKLSWLQDPAFKTSSYAITRSQNGSLFVKNGTATTPQYDDATFTSDGNYCYKINYTDLCNNNSADGVPACPLKLAGTLDKKNAVTLNWADYTGWSQGVKSYTVEKYDKNGGLLQSTDVGTNLTFIDDQTDLRNQIVYYKIVANPNNPASAMSVSNEIEIIKEAHLFYPNAFTPNQDKLNDNFNVSGQYIAKLELQIFDRWGSLIFYTDKNESWDGTQNGVAMPEASYVWTANVIDISGRHFKRTGTILLLQKAK